MIYGCLILSITIGITMIISGFIIHDIDKFDALAAYIGGIVLTVLVVALLIPISDSLRVKAIDVYRGNTTLRITYEDGIPVDSIVVRKNK